MPRFPLGRLFVLLALAALAGTATGCRQSGQSAQIKVLVPDDKDHDKPLEVQLNGKPTTETGTQRIIRTPPLESGKEHTFIVKAIIKPNNYTTITRSRPVQVQPGQTIEVDLRQEDKKDPDILVRYYPTPYEVVDAMIKMGEMTKDDVVYDLGCGDGRMVIRAVQQGAKRGVGIDIDTKRIAESRENAKKAGVEDKVEFHLGDVLKGQNISDATLVLLYMGRDLNIALEPILKKSLKPGTRVVSHRFLMSDEWPPLKTQRITAKNNEDKDEEYELHLWKIGQDGGKKE
jgi:uncharacterized protein (TIGR03000 family)